MKKPRKYDDLIANLFVALVLITLGLVFYRQPQLFLDWLHRTMDYLSTAGWIW